MRRPDRTRTLALIGAATMAVGALMPWRTAGSFDWPGNSGGAGYVLIAAALTFVVTAARPTLRIPAFTIVLAAGLVAFYVTARNLGAPDPLGSGVGVSQVGSVLTIGSAVDRLWWQRNRSPRSRWAHVGAQNGRPTPNDRGR